MNREAIKAAAAKMESTRDLLNLLNKIKMDELKDKGHPFTMPQLNYFINPKRNKDSYRTFHIPKKSGGCRTISAPVRMLKSFQHCANLLLQAFYDAPECVTGFVPAKSVVDNAGRHLGMNYVFNSDLKDFFPSISKSRVWATLKTRPFSFNDTVADALAGLCCTVLDTDGDGKPYIGLPQGAPSSPALTNIVCHNLDWKLAGLARRFKVHYSRYADDITFSSNYSVFGEGSEFMTEFRRIVASEHFTLNEKKTRLQKRGSRQEVTGLVVSDRVNVPREYVRDLDNLLYIWERHGRGAAFAKFLSRYVPKQDLLTRIPSMESVVAGKLMFLRMVKGEESPVWRRLQRRYNNVTGRKPSYAGTDIIYLQTYPVQEFEEKVGTKVNWRTDPEDPADGMLIPRFELNGRMYTVALSRYARTRLGHILEGGSDAELEAFKLRYHIGLCRREKDPEDCTFWMIFRRPPRMGSSRKRPERSPEELDAIAVGDLSGQEDSGKTAAGLAASPADSMKDITWTAEDEPGGSFDDADFDMDFDGGGGSGLSIPEPVTEPEPAIEPAADGTPGGVLSTDETLRQLISSHFDLNILDKWDKTRNS